MITYILKATLFSALLFLIYFLFMEKEKMHRYKRIYLLVSIVLPFIVPLITIPTLSFVPQLPIAINLSAISPAGIDIPDNPFNSYSITESDIAVTDIQNTAPQPSSASGGKEIWFILLVISYILVTLVMIIRFIRNIISIYLTIISNKSVAYQEGTLVLTIENRIPHSFLKYIFVNREDYERGLIEKEILRHELTHVSQKHSLDILFVESIMIFAWINPLLFFYRKAIRLNHEFLADQSVVFGIEDEVRQHQAEPVQNFGEAEEQQHQRLEFERLITPGSGVSQVLLDEYEKIIRKYTPASMTGGEQTGNIRENITPEDKARLEDVYSRMSVEQRKEQRVVFVPYTFMIWEKNSPTLQQLEQFKNPQTYGLWIDGGRVGNEVLENYSNTDFAQVFISRLTRTAKNYGKHDFQVGLYTNEYVKNHNDYYASKEEYRLLFRIKAPKK